MYHLSPVISPNLISIPAAISSSVAMADLLLEHSSPVHPPSAMLQTANSLRSLSIRHRVHVTACSALVSGSEDDVNPQNLSYTPLESTYINCWD
jgi:hypothetical protein